MSEETNQDEVVVPVKPKQPKDYYGTFDTSIIYEYKDQPDIVSGRCDNCGEAKFKSSVKNFQYLRECRNCGMTKNI